MKSKVTQVLETLVAVDRTALVEGGKIVTVDNPVFFSPFTLRSYMDLLQAQVSNADAKGYGTALAVADAATAPSLAGEGWMYEVIFKDSSVSGDFRPFTAVLAYTDKDGVSVSRSIKLDPEPPLMRAYVLALKTVNDRTQLALPNSSGVTVTAASNTLRAGSSLSVVSYTRRDLEMVRRQIGG